jgi:DNA repair protein RadC
MDKSGNYVPDTSERPGVISSPQDARKWFDFIEANEQESFAIICLDGANKPISAHECTRGLVNCSPCHAREVFREAIRRNAVSIILGHNHPSGSLTPSSTDLATTKKLLEASKLLDIPVLDHIIVSSQGATSIRESHPGLWGKD